MNSFDTIIKKYREQSFSQRQKGEKFERLIWAYFLTEKIYRNTYQRVWMWDDFPNKGDFGGADVGIDLVGLTNIGKFHAIQCKFYEEGSQVDKKGVDSFLATSQKTFAGHKRFASRYFVSTTNNWSRPAELAIRNQNPPVQRIRLSDLRNANVDWVKLNGAITGEDAIKDAPKELRDYQQEALEEALSHYDKYRRGKLIMACGTGKTLTSLRISEAITDSEGMVLFLMPSLALLGQTIRAWNDDAKKMMYTIVVCSDPKTNQFKAYEEDSLLGSLVDIGLPASTDPQEIFHQIKGFREKQNREGGLIVIFSTYHSIGVSARAQEMLSIEGIDAEFDLIICDEAHQTTGIRRSGEDNTAFTLVHDNDKIRSKKRMYMTATPRMYSDQAKTQASDSDADVYSMDDEGKYGKEFYRLGFAQAVKLRQLSPYQVLALGYRPEDIPQDLQEYIKKKEGVLEGKTREVTDLMSSLGATIGCINAMAKRGLNDQVIFRFASLNNLSPEELKDPQPMKTAVAFCKTVAHSKTVRNLFNSLSDALRDAEEFSTINGNKKRVYAQAEHVDGYMDVPKRDALLDWLKSPQAETDHPTCKVLSNVRCLSEGVDVPSLDAALFISPKDSQIEVVQAVGRVMRKATGKKFGYIIIPVLMEEGANYRDILDKKKNFRTVWTVLKALKAHDEDFNVVIEKMKINTPTHTEHSGPGGGQEIEVTEKLRRDIIAMSSKVKAVLVDWLTDRSYWTSWAKEAGMMARKQEEDIRKIIEQDVDKKQMFQEFLDGLKKSVSPNITEDQAREMLGQHMVTKPIFESLFEGYSFANKNAVSASMEVVVEYIQENL
ncbi:MAG: DEAD/DEAH box helicase family protein, partial [Flavobacteriaceae bacterium]|nr:DEAD/DEAH box helicase family protein [Flavobacteriaceae bacterium]